MNAEMFVSFTEALKNFLLKEEINVTYSSFSKSVFTNFGEITHVT